MRVGVDFHPTATQIRLGGRRASFRRIAGLWIYANSRGLSIEGLMETGPPSRFRLEIRDRDVLEKIRNYCTQLILEEQ